MFKATRPSILASLVSSILQAACGFLWAFGPPGAGAGFSLLTAVALAVPLAALLASRLRGNRPGTQRHGAADLRVHCWLRVRGYF